MTLSYLLELRLSSPLSPSTSFWSIPFPSEPSPSSSPSQSSSTSTVTSQSNKIWSQQLLSSPPLSIQTCQLWTPSRSLPLQTPQPQPKRHQQEEDFRFGPLTIERIKLSSFSSSMNPPSSSNIAQLPPGSLHLYKHPSPSPSSSSLDASHTLALVSVPTLLNPTQILQFISNSSDSEWLLNGLIEEMRILRDHNPSRSIVLIKFRPQQEGIKEKFRSEFEGKKYWESKDVRFFLSLFLVLVEGVLINGKKWFRVHYRVRFVKF